jgi:DNA-binding response OmpR family regulator/HPt (histidine-containing phosphotransfer) domain-containing protein
MRILLVEDDELISKALEKILSGQNYMVDVATNGQMGWEFVEAFVYELIILDIVLPQLDGIRFCRRLREQGYQIPVLLLTAQNSSNDKVMGLDAGADDYVVKPFEMTELLARIRVLLRRSSTSTLVTLEWSKLCLDPSLCKVTYRDQPLHLTPKEYRLLELLLRNHHRVFSRSAILDHLWPYEQAPSEDAVTVHIKDLRRKLKKLGAPSDLIETVYGQGYRLKQQEETTVAKEAISATPQSQGNLSDQRIKAELKTVWEKHRTLNQDRLALLEQTVAKLLKQRLAKEQMQAAQQVAHKLAGALGIFGFTAASEVARSIEEKFDHFLDFKSPIQHHALLLSQQLKALKMLIENPNSNPVTAVKHPLLQPKGIANHSLLLIFDDDAKLARQCVKLATDRGLSVTVSANLSALEDRNFANEKERMMGDIIVLNLALADAMKTDLAHLAEIVNQTPPTPVLLFTTQNSLANRVKVSALAAHVSLHKSMAPEAVLDLVEKVRSHRHTTAANIMAVDDDPNLLAGMRSLLEPFGLRLTTLDQPHQVLPVLEECLPDLLLLDLKMPQFSGVELCQVLRNTPQWSGLPILFFTAHANNTTLSQMYAAGANDCISKTVSPSELVTRILNCTERNRLLRCATHLAIRA